MNNFRKSYEKVSNHKYHKGTVDVILGDPLYKEWHVGFTAVLHSFLTSCFTIDNKLFLGRKSKISFYLWSDKACESGIPLFNWNLTL